MEGDDHGLFAFQRRVVDWALATERCAALLDPGMGKTLIFLSWCDRLLALNPRGVILVLAPLATGSQIVAQAAAMRLQNCVVQTRAMPPRPTDLDAFGGRGLVAVANHEKAARFSGAMAGYVGVVVDESSELRSASLQTALRGSRGVRFRLCLSATPAPGGDFSELAAHAAFLGRGTLEELSARFFKSSSRLALREGAESAFAEWMLSWSAWARSPAELGFPQDADRFRLPPVELRALPAPSRNLHDRVAAVARHVTGPCVVWCSRNAESVALAAALGEGAAELTGAVSLEQKELLLERFKAGAIRVLVTKHSLTGHGLNWAHVSQHVFFSLPSSPALFFQMLSRSLRYGQTAARVEATVVGEDDRAAAEALVQGERVHALHSIVRERMALRWADGATLERLLAPSDRFQRHETDKATLVQWEGAAAITRFVAPGGAALVAFAMPPGLEACCLFIWCLFIYLL